MSSQHPNLEFPFEVRRVAPYVYDLFFGKQWDEHTRVKQGRSSTYVVSGRALPHPVLKHLHELLAPNMPINYGQPHEQTLNNCFNA